MREKDGGYTRSERAQAAMRKGKRTAALKGGCFIEKEENYFFA